MSEPLLSLTKLLDKLIEPISKNIQQQQAQQLAVLSAKESVDALTLSKHNFPLSPNWTVEELTAHVIEPENLGNLPFLLDALKDLATYGATSEFFISTIRLLEQGGGTWG